MKSRMMVLYRILGLLTVGGAICLIAAESNSGLQIKRMATGDVEVTSTAHESGRFRVESSTDLIIWKTRAIVEVEDGALEFVDSVSKDQPQRYYRTTPETDESRITGDVINTSAGDVIIHPISHASFVLQWGDIEIYNDPVGNAVLFNDLPEPDLILVSHQHGDHFSGSTISDMGGSPEIIAPAAVVSRMVSSQREITRTLENGESVERGGVKVEAVPAYNGRHPEGRDNGYVLTIGDKRFYMAGDTEDIPEMRALTNIAVAFLPMNVPFTMTVDAAADAVGEFKPGIVYPYHYRNQNGSLADLSRFKSQVGNNSEVRLRDWY